MRMPAIRRRSSSPARWRSTCRRSNESAADPRPRAGRHPSSGQGAPLRGAALARGRGRRARVRPRRPGRHDRCCRCDARPRGRRRQRRRGARRDGSLGDSRASSTVTRIRRSRAIGSGSSRSAPSGASYEELLAAGGGILSTTRATRAAGAAALREIVVRHRDAMLRHGTTTFEGKSGYGLDRDTELAQLDAVAAAGGVPTWLGAHAVPPEQRDADAYVDWAIAEVLPDAAKDRRGRRCLRRAWRLRHRAGEAVPPCVRGRRTRAQAAWRPALGDGRGTARARIGRPLRRPSRVDWAGRRLGPRGERRRGCVTARRRALPRSADAACSGARRRGGDRRPRDGLQPGERVLRKPPRRRDARRARSSGFRRRRRSRA